MAAMIDLSDSELVRASADDPAAFETLFVRHAREVRTWLSAQVGDVEVANDLLAETFAQAWRSRRRFRGSEPGDGLSWLYGIARNLLRRHYKRGRVEARARLRLGMMSTFHEMDGSHEVLGRITAERLAPQLSRALRRLPMKQQRAVDARIVRELGYESVAAELVCSQPAARALVSRALRNVNSQLEEGTVDRDDF
jgi:RNA polymerase sigma factor (sigma-70 family)